MAGMIGSMINSFRYVGGDDRDTDFVDRMHSYLTTNLLIAFAVLVSFKQFGGRPIECMTPDTFTSAMEQYTESYCWSRDTYVLPFDEEIPLSVHERGETEISYYQWVPFFLLFQALCFRVPSLLWKYMASQSGWLAHYCRFCKTGIRIHDIIRLSIDEKNIDPTGREGTLKIMCTHLQNALRFHRRLVRKDFRPYRFVRCCNLPYSTFYVCMLYLLVKLLFLVNVIAQLYSMNKFLMTDAHGLFGLQSIVHLVNGSEWEMSGVFPRVSMCDVQARVLGGVQRFSIQCVLVINLFNEKIFVLLWFWFMILFVMSLFSFIYWTYVIVWPNCGADFISRNLELADMPFDPKASRQQVCRFVSQYLKSDGVFVLRMVTMHTNIIFGTEITRILWDKYYGIEEQVQALTPSAKAPNTAPVFGGKDMMWSNVRLRARNGGNASAGANYYDDSQLDVIKERQFQSDMDKLLGERPMHTVISIDQPDGGGNRRRGSFGRSSLSRLRMPGQHHPVHAAGPFGLRQRTHTTESEDQDERERREREEEQLEREREERERETSDL